MDATAKIIVTPDPNVQIYSNLTLRKSQREVTQLL